MTLTATVDSRAVIQGIGTLVADLRTRTKQAAAESADAVVREAQARVARRTGDTMRSIHREDSYDGRGSVVLVTRNAPRQLPYWLEYGTRYMSRQPFLFASAALEAGPHADRTAEAVATAIAVNGFGG